MKRDGKATRKAAVLSLRESRRKGYSSSEALKHLALELDMGVPSARSVRDYLIRSGEWKGEQ